jgi:bacterial/archaeal transporter family-2 protein
VNALGYATLALLAGCLLPFQVGMNAVLADWVGGSVRAAVVSFLVGGAALLLLSLLLFRDRELGELGRAPWWVWVGGLLGAFYVATTAFAAPALGAAFLFVILVAGQAGAALVLDHFGWVGFPEQAVTPGRIAGVALVAAGVALVRFA